jgi:hypothetical protein
MNTGAPRKEVRTATGRTCGAMIVRATVSAARSRRAPQIILAGIKKR